MTDPETLLAEAFGFGLFEHVEALQKQIDDTLERYGDSALSSNDLADAAGGGISDATAIVGQTGRNKISECPPDFPLSFV